MAVLCLARAGWMDVDGELIEPNTITMYELMRYIIKPLTQYSTGTCSYVERCSETVVQPSWTVRPRDSKERFQCGALALMAVIAL